MASRTYVYYQPNKKDLKDKHGDCVIRALTKVLDKDWLYVFDELVPIAREIQTTLNEQGVYVELLTRRRFKYTGVSNKRGTKRPTVKSFAQEHKTGTYLCNLANHVVAIVDGKYYDTWDCGEKCLYGYYTKED